MGSSGIKSQYLSPTLGIQTEANKMHVTVIQILRSSQAPRFKGRFVINHSQVYTVRILLYLVLCKKQYSKKNIFTICNYNDMQDMLLQVQVCGLLTKIEHEETYTDFSIFDGTGEISARAW